MSRDSEERSINQDSAATPSPRRIVSEALEVLSQDTMESSVGEVLARSDGGEITVAIQDLAHGLDELLAENDKLAAEVERRASENARLQDGVIQMVSALWAIYEQAQSVARKPSPA